MEVVTNMGKVTIPNTIEYTALIEINGSRIELKFGEFAR